MAAKRVTVIPAKPKFDQAAPEGLSRKRRVAAYALVSTQQEEQASSFEAQVDYYTRYIQSKPEWEFVRVYADEGISGTSTRKRDGFNEMIQDALAGKIDLILTKSISRFARNTVTTLTYVRQLRERGVEVFFEKENIYTLDSKGELLITIMSSLAQEESRSISENVTWGQRKRFADGKVTICYSRFLGYKKGPDGEPAIDEHEAQIVRLIYRLCLYGKSDTYIARLLDEEGIPTASNGRWSANAVESILTNVKYKGAAELQKTYTVDFLTKKRRINDGQVAKYYVENSHPAIISPEVFDLVQYERARLKEKGLLRVNTTYPFSGRIICGECGSLYGRVQWYKDDTSWSCNERTRHGACHPPVLREREIMAGFLCAYNRIAGRIDEIRAAYADVIDALTDTSQIDKERERLEAECAGVMELTRKLISDNAQRPLDQADFRRRYENLVDRYQGLCSRIQALDTEATERRNKRTRIELFLSEVDAHRTITEYDEELWYATVDTVEVYAGKRMVFNFRDGRQETVLPEEW